MSWVQQRVKICIYIWGGGGICSCASNDMFYMDKWISPFIILFNPSAVYRTFTDAIRKKISICIRFFISSHFVLSVKKGNSFSPPMISSFVVDLRCRFPWIFQSHNMDGYNYLSSKNVTVKYNSLPQGFYSCHSYTLTNGNPI